MNVDVLLSPTGLTPESLRGRFVVVIDVLRASSTIVTALVNGARAVIPVAELGDAGRLAGAMDSDVVLLGGERHGTALPGYGAGNSPLEYTVEVVSGKTIVLTTTNGTAAIAAAKNAEATAVGCFLNASAAAGFVARAFAAEKPVTLLCAGSDGQVALEDALCAGLLLHKVVPPSAASALGDSAKIAYALYRGSKDSLPRALVGASHTRTLIALGFGDDVAYCSRIDAMDALPVMRDNRLVLAASAPATLG